MSSLKKADGPVSANTLADKLKVSRQIIVGDVALLRAGGQEITATPRGYVLDSSKPEYGYVGTLACCHETIEELMTELYTIVDYGGVVIDVTVEHSVYGQLIGQLNVASRFDADNFLAILQKNQAKPLSNLTGGYHTHRIGCTSEEQFAIIREQLRSRNIAL